MSESARKRRAVWDSPKELLERLRNRSPLAGWREEFLRAYVTYGTRQRSDGRFELKCPPEIEAQVYAAAPAHDGWERLPDVHAPTLLLTGETSPLWSDGRAAAAAERIPNVHAEVVGGGHFFPMENPDETIDRVLRFLSD
jgi:pimeloyl-ACP methyl ester carboxylesterase